MNATKLRIQQQLSYNQLAKDDLLGFNCIVNVKGQFAIYDTVDKKQITKWYDDYYKCLKRFYKFYEVNMGQS